LSIQPVGARPRRGFPARPLAGIIDSRCFLFLRARG
jgi:hypothetical protein